MLRWFKLRLHSQNYTTLVSAKQLQVCTSHQDRLYTVWSVDCPVSICVGSLCRRTRSVWEKKKKSLKTSAAAAKVKKTTTTNHTFGPIKTSLWGKATAETASWLHLMSNDYNYNNWRWEILFWEACSAQSVGAEWGEVSHLRLLLQESSSRKVQTEVTASQSEGEKDPVRTQRT